MYEFGCSSYMVKPGKLWTQVDALEPATTGSAWRKYLVSGS
jgi:hypothetical protein